MTQQNKNLVLGVDLGMGAIKIYGPHGSIELPSHLATANRELIGYASSGLYGARSSATPLKITLHHGASYYAGMGAHNWGTPVDNLSYGKLLDSTDIRVLLYAALTRYAQQYEISLGESDLTIVAGMPQESMKGDEFDQSKKQVKKWMRGEHTWTCDDNPYFIKVSHIDVVTQPQGITADFMLDDEANVIKSHAGAVKAKRLILTIGFNTVELLAMDGNEIVPNMTDGTPLGVHRVKKHLESGHYLTYGQLDSKIRKGSQDVQEAIKAWRGEVLGYLRDMWGTQWKNYPLIIASGGGAALLNGDLINHFTGRCQIARDPVLAVSRGLYKMGLRKAKRHG